MSIYERKITKSSQKDCSFEIIPEYYKSKGGMLIMKINVHGGHNKYSTGASKYLNELTEDRKVKNEVIRLLKAQGHTVYDCTDDVGKTQNANLSNIVKKCNPHSVDLDVSIHLNAGSGTGVEVYVYSDTSSYAKTIATRICEKIAKTLDIKNRRMKYSSSLYVLKHAKAPALLIEYCFVDSKADKEKWNTKKCAQAIVEGILNKTISTGSGSSSSSTKTNFLIKVSGVSKGDVLNIRANANASSKKTGSLAYNDPNQYTIVETKKNGTETWGKLKSGIGWINLRYTKKV